MELNKAIQNRKSVRHFAKKAPNWRDIIECIDSARYAPTAGNLFPMRFIVVDDEDTIKKLADAAQQPFVADAKYVVVLCTDPKMVLNAYQERAAKFCRQQAGAAIENFLLKAEEKGLATCWVGYFVDYLIKEALGVPEQMDVEALFPVGLESKEMGTKKKEKRKIDMDRMLYFNKWKNTRMTPPRKLEV